jgi:hypothetical protein
MRPSDLDASTSIAYLLCQPNTALVRNSFNHAGSTNFAALDQRTYLFHTDSNSYCASCQYQPGKLAYRSPSGYPSGVHRCQGQYHLRYLRRSRQV